MKKSPIIHLCFWVLLIGAKYANAQSSITVGGDAKTTNVGAVSYSIGQVDYIWTKSTAGSLNEGVQQPFEIFILSGIEEKRIGLSYQVSVYPNPASTLLILNIENYKSSNLAYEMSDMLGKMISRKQVEGTETIIRMDELALGNYLISVVDNNQIVKTFKIIKNQ